jgi:RNA polymerase sigma factor (sigma-70 family)
MDAGDPVFPPASTTAWMAAQEGLDPLRAAERHGDWVARFDRLVHELSTLVCDRWPPADDQRAGYGRRVWNCFEHHWKRMATGGPLTFDQVRTRFEERELGIRVGDVNLLEEVMLAQAMEFKQAKAAEMFEAQYMPDVRRIARHSGGPRAAESVENLAADLILPRPQRDGSALAPRIAGYQGRTSLRSWLRSVIVHRWISETRKAPMAVMAEAQAIADPRASAPAMTDGCEELLGPIFTEAVRAIGAEDRMMIKMLVLDNVQQQTLARTLGLHTGNVTRRRQRALEQILAHATSAGRGGSSAGQFDECLEAVLTGDDGDLRQTMANALAAAFAQNPGQAGRGN